MQKSLETLAAEIKRCLDSMESRARKLHAIKELTEDEIYAWLAVIERRGNSSARTAH